MKRKMAENLTMLSFAKGVHQRHRDRPPKAENSVLRSPVCPYTDRKAPVHPEQLNEPVLFNKTGV